MRLRTGSKRALLAIGGAALGLTLAVALAVPAQAATRTVDDPSTDPPALKAWLSHDDIVATSAAADVIVGDPASVSDDTDATTSIQDTDSERITEYRGTVLLWTENSLEWYWTAKKITKSKGWQTDGYVFPNTAALGGIKKTYSTASLQNWRAIESIGAGVVSPWGNINIYKADYTDYFTIHLGGAYKHTS